MRRMPWHCTHDTSQRTLFKTSFSISLLWKMEIISWSWQMMKLEESRRRSLLQENHLLSENISSLQSQINKLESSAACSHFSMEKNVVSFLFSRIFQLIIIAAFFEIRIFKKGNNFCLVRDWIYYFILYLLSYGQHCNDNFSFWCSLPLKMGTQIIG